MFGKSRQDLVQRLAVPGNFRREVLPSHDEMLLTDALFLLSLLSNINAKNDTWHELLPALPT